MTVGARHASGGTPRAWLFALLGALLVLAAGQVVAYYAQESELEQERSDVLHRLSTVRARLEGLVNVNLSLVHGLTAVIESRPDIDQAGFAAIADGLVDKRYALRNIGAAPDLVLSLMYPLKGNEAALGLDYRQHPVQREAALRARDSGRTVIAGPLSLEQGGVAIIARKPVFLPAAEAGGEKRFWGLVSAAIDVETLYEQAGLRDSDLGLRVALRGRDGSGARGAGFFGDAALFGDDPVTVEVTLPGGGSWQMAAIPADGWGRVDAGIVLLRLVTFLLALAAAVMAYRLVRGGELLASHSARLDALLKTLPDLVWLKDANGVYLSCNPRFELFFGAPEAEIRGKTDHDFVPADLADFFREKDRAAIAAGGPRVNEEWVSFASDGHRELLETIKTPVFDGRGRLLGVLGIARDITQRKQAEASLREQEAFFRLIAENMGDMVTVLDVQGRRLYDSPAYRALFGNPEEVQEPDPFASVHPDDREGVRRAFATTIATGVGTRGTFRVVLPGGGWRDIESQGGVIRNIDGRVERVVVVSRDVSERKRMEDRIHQLNADLEARVSQRTAELDAVNKELQTFTYSVSHDLKAPLRGIDGYCRLLLEDHREQLGEEGRVFLDNVRNGVAHMARLIEDLLAYSRLERRGLHGQTLDLSRQAGMVLDSRRAEIQALGMVVDVRLHGLSACADPAALNIVLRNLVDNALKFARQSQPPKLAISGTQSEKSVTVAIKDNGIGFDMRFHERIFEIFQRLQRAEDYPGTGVGLAIVHKAAQRMGGRVWAESQLGRGATFYLELPR
ncbi:MAG: Phytochrome-like protein cph1 [Candidatus Accumulibacter regalis]|uniref:histidine kinase n=1 Tax=Accumulibacter regalis TaxID=522306 RepID=A0A011PV11_ACCRE|nr:PAS domain S-box protein [Accumulibacter sp.]EXI91236.1 MAG: Phytochrome-like protein cph1 [Candidatus Accumulibacter regalis]HRE70100.1 PAS domain S-box protein [Accumulibacter sp.]HRE86874.1 PAS domain S-box protein [Accumulibacter sp.]